MVKKVPPNLRIFLNYRRQDSAGHAGRLYDALVARFGRNAVFMDIDTIPVGVDITDVIRDAVSDCDVLIAMLGREWLGAVDKAGGRRLERTDDYVRLELEAALENEVRILPVLVQGAEMPEAHELPAGLVPLVRRNAFELSDRHWHTDVQELCDALERVYARLHAAGSTAVRSHSTPPSAAPPTAATGSLTSSAEPLTHATGPGSDPGAERREPISDPRPLADGAQSDGVTSPPATPVPTPSVGRSARRRDRRRVATAGAVLAAVVGLGTVGYAVTRSGSSASSSGSCASGVVKAPATDVYVPDGSLATDGQRLGLVSSGALLPVGADEAPFYKAAHPIAALTSDEFGKVDRRPRDGTVFQVGSTTVGAPPTLYFSAGGAVFPTERAALDQFAPNAPVPVLVPNGGLVEAPRSPRSGSLIHVAGSGHPVWLIHNGSRGIASSLCRAPIIIQVPNSPGILNEIPTGGHLVAATTTTVSTPRPTLPDPGQGLVARTCRRDGERVLVDGSLTNQADHALRFVVGVRLVAADGSEITRGEADLQISSQATQDWNVVLDGPSIANTKVDHCEYLVSSRGVALPSR